MASVSCYNITTTSVSVKLIGLDSAYAGSQRRLYWRGRKSSDSYPQQADNYPDDVIYIVNGTTESPGYTYNNLIPGTTYYFKATVTFENSTIEYYFEGSCTTESASADMIICGFTPSSVSLKLINATKGYWYWRHKIYGGSYPTGAEYSSTVETEGGSSTIVTFPNLSFGNFYNFKATFQYDPYPYTEVSRINCAPVSGDYLNLFSHETWNFMVDSIYMYRNNTWSTTTGYTLNPANTKITSSPYTLTAAKFNQLWYNLQKIKTGMANSFPVATNSSTSGAGSEYHVYAYRFYDANEWCLNDGLTAMQ